MNRTIEDFLQDIEEEYVTLKQYYDIQKDKKLIIAENNNIIKHNDEKLTYTEKEIISEKTIYILENIEQNLYHLEILQKDLNRIEEDLIESQLRKIKNQYYDTLLNDAISKYSGYSVLKRDLIKIILANSKEIEEFNKEMAVVIKKLNIKAEVRDIQNVDTEKEPVKEIKRANNIKESNVKRSGVGNKVLVISEREGKVYLPYLINDLQKELKSKRNYNTIEELIEGEYIVELKRFKNSMIARFKEAYKLIRKKEKGSFLEATQLGIELMFNYKLNPAVIAACKNEDELDIYIDCLDENELEEFKIFDVKFEIAPSIVGGF